MEFLNVQIEVSAIEPRWSVAKAWEWYHAQPWIVGCNFSPSTASNQLEFWQKDCFDRETIDRELGWMAELGMNAARVYLHNLVLEDDEPGFIKRLEQFLTIASKHGIQPLFALLDDCWNSGACLGPQPEPRPGVHNSRWLQCPGHEIVNDESAWPRIERYVKGVMVPFAEDDRVLGWDLYNEPGAGGQGKKSAPVLWKVFQWAREARPIQPLTAGAWGADQEMDDLMCRLSDVVTFHHYVSAEKAEENLVRWANYGRPMICTEWLARNNQRVGEMLPWFHKKGIGCINWGFVSGRTQTIYPWGSAEGSPEPEMWFHDLLRQDGTPFDTAETALFRELTAKPVLS